MEPMRDAFVRSEEFLDLECIASGREQNQTLVEMHHVMHDMTQNTTAEQLDSMLEALLLLREQGAGNIRGQDRRLLMQMPQSA